MRSYKCNLILLVAIMLLGSVIFYGNTVQACSRVLWNDNSQAVLVGRNMDWLEDMKTNLWVLPRGMQRESKVGKNSLSWTSRYGSVVSVSYDSATADGINEKGLNIALLWLAESEYGQRNENLPGMLISLWGQYFLDNFATVKEAVSVFEKTPFQLLSGTVGTSGREARLHLSIADATGDSAIIEYINGKPKIYHNRQYTVMTNSPTFDKQIDNLKQYKGFGGVQPLPGTTEAADRFVRAAFYLKQLPKPLNHKQAVAGIISVMRNIAQPFGVADPARPNISATIWRTVSDLTNKVYFFESTTSPYLMWVRLEKMNFNEGAPAMKLDIVNNPDYLGDVSAEFKPAKAFSFIPD